MFKTSEIKRKFCEKSKNRGETSRGKYFYKKVKIIPSKFCNNAKFFPRPKDPKVQKSSNVEKIFTENI